MPATQLRNKREEKVKKTETSKNLEERVRLLENITKYCEDMSSEPKTDQNKDAETQLQDLEEMWGRYGYLLSETTPGSDIDTTKFFDALFPSLQEGNAKVVELVIQNFELLLDVSGDSLIPLVRGIEAKIKHYVYEQAQFYTMMAMLCRRYGQFLNIHNEFDNYLDDFEKEKTTEALDFFAALLRACGRRLKRESMVRLLNILLKCDEKLRTNRRYIRCLNEFFPLNFPDLPLEQALTDLFKHTQGRIFSDPEYIEELEKCHLLAKSFSYGL